MPRSITINGIRLDEIRMPLPSLGTGTLSSLGCAVSDIKLAQRDSRLGLRIPAYLAVELYRLAILPQDRNLPVEIAISGRSIGWYRVSDVRYAARPTSPYGEVTFTLARVVEQQASSAASTEPLSRSNAPSGTYVTDITHYLDETGEMPAMPRPARKLASFLTLLIEAATSNPSNHPHESGIRCRTKSCRGIIRTALSPNRDEILWHCPTCGHEGIIRNWQGTKWNQLKPAE